MFRCFNSLWELAGLVTSKPVLWQYDEYYQFQFPMGISGFGDCSCLPRLKRWLACFNSLWELAGLVTQHFLGRLVDHPDLFQFPMGISGFGDPGHKGYRVSRAYSFNSLWELAGLVTLGSLSLNIRSVVFQFPMGISGFGDARLGLNADRRKRAVSIPYGN